MHILLLYWRQNLEIRKQNWIQKCILEGREPKPLRHPTQEKSQRNEGLGYLSSATNKVGWLTTKLVIFPAIRVLSLLAGA